MRLDHTLFDINANERSISHRLAVYIEHALRNETGLSKALTVDCEYNRHGAKTKALPTPEQVLSDDLSGPTIYPDILIHIRGNNELNLLAIEMMKSDKINDAVKVRHDRTKLEALRNQPYSYQETALVTAPVRPGQAMTIEWADGKLETLGVLKRSGFSNVDGTLLYSSTKPGADAN